MDMEFRVLDENLNVYNIIDAYQSAIWTIRFNSYGDFEIYTPVSKLMLDCMRVGWYLFTDKFYYNDRDSAELMIIESIVIESDVESGNKIKITGRDLKVILNRRIIWGQKTFNNGTSLKDVVTTLINESIISPSDWSRTYQSGDGRTITVSVRGADRKIDNFVIIDSGETYPSLTADVQFNGETIYEAIEKLCESYKIGFSVVYNFTTGKFEFRLLNLRDCTYDQTVNPPLLFSPSFENLKNSNYLESDAEERNVALVGGEGDEYNIMYNIYGSGYNISGDVVSGLKRKEVFVNASDVSRSTDDGTIHPNAKYLSMLLEKCKTEMENNYKYVQTYEGTAETSRGYQYPEDFTIGDKVEIVNEWGISSKVIISEIILSVSTEGQSIVPTFSTLTEEGGET